MFKTIILEGVKGVGKVELSLSPDSRIFSFIGENGVGKTKLLESLFQILLTSHEVARTLKGVAVLPETWVLSKAKIDNTIYSFPIVPSGIANAFNGSASHSLPVVYMASQNRGFIKHSGNSAPPIGKFSQRREQYISLLFSEMQHNFSNLNMESDIEQWFVTRAQSSNAYQKQEDNRDIELQAVIKLLHQIDSRIDPEFMEISADNRVSLKINDEKRELSQLSTGFASILKIIQTIISGYGFFTNERKLLSIKGLVLIDEIESHLHLSWQSKIIPLLKRLFPNTIFFISTHSSIVLTQLKEGEAYRLQRDEDGVVRSKPVSAPGKAALIDVLKDAFDVDLNKMKYERMSADQQKSEKQKLLNLLEQGVSE